MKKNDVSKPSLGAIIIGAQKSGTTQLASYLESHPGVCLSNPKEPDFFTRFFDKGLEWYAQRFECLDKFLIEASTSYSARPYYSKLRCEVSQHPYYEVPDRIQSYYPNIKLIYITRDPVERAYSAFWHQVRAGHESRNLQQAMLESDYYVRLSDYEGQLSYYKAKFDKSQILELSFSELIANPLKVVNNTLKFLDLPELKELNTQQHKNKSFQYPPTLVKINQLTAKLGGLNSVVKKVRKILPDSFVQKIGSVLVKPVPKMSDADAQIIQLALSSYKKQARYD